MTLIRKAKEVLYFQMASSLAGKRQLQLLKKPNKFLRLLKNFTPKICGRKRNEIY